MSRIGLVACASKKGEYATKARDLYVSPLFTKSRNYVEHTCDSWYILSAKHGLLDPDAIIAPYEETLNSRSNVERRIWARDVTLALESRLILGDHIVMLAGEKYREFLLDELIQRGLTVEVPMQGLGIGKQLQWLSRSNSTRNQDLDRLYDALQHLESGLGGRRRLSECTGHLDWPRRGLYFFFEASEFRNNSRVPRITRIGTHGVSQGSKSTLWNRLRTHKGTESGLGNHRSSIFRLHVGAALARKHSNLHRPTWGIGQSANADVRQAEVESERAVSKYLSSMNILWLAIGDTPGPTSDRAYLERNLIGLLVGKNGPCDLPSANWLGNFSPNERIRKSGLWNLDYLDYSYDRRFLDVLDEYVNITIGNKPLPSQSIAPANWSTSKRTPKENQMKLFEELY